MRNHIKQTQKKDKATICFISSIKKSIIAHILDFLP